MNGGYLTSSSLTKRSGPAWDISYPANTVTDWGYWDGVGTYPYLRTLTVGVNLSSHRVCGCPKCAGDCCDCADCKVKRLEARVAELEGKS